MDEIHAVIEQTFARQDKVYKAILGIGLPADHLYRNFQYIYGKYSRARKEYMKNAWFEEFKYNTMNLNSLVKEHSCRNDKMST